MADSRSDRPFLKEKHVFLIASRLAPPSPYATTGVERTKQRFGNARTTTFGRHEQMYAGLLGEGRMANGEGRMAKGYGRRTKGEGRSPTHYFRRYLVDALRKNQVRDQRGINAQSHIRAGNQMVSGNMWTMFHKILRYLLMLLV
jgi:hypothetical protein